MFHLLIESKAPRRTPLGGSAVSAAGHAALVAALVVLSARADAPAARVPEDRVIFTPPMPPLPPTPIHAPPHVATSPSSSTTPAPKEVPSLVPPIEILVGIPPIDLSLLASPSHEDSWSAGPRGSRGDGVPGGTGTGTGAAMATGVFREEQVDTPVFLAPGMTAPRYPDGLRAAGVSGSVMVEFVVDTAGRVEPRSIQLIQTDHVLFASAVRDVLPRYRFIPAEAGGRKVRQLVRLPFRFDLHHE